MTLDSEKAAAPKPIMGFYDGPMWESISNRRMALQCCSECGTFRYPPGPVCPSCLSAHAELTPLSGGGTIISWVVFHRQYLPAYPPPHHVIAVKLDEGPVMISGLEGPKPENEWIGQRVRMVYSEKSDGLVLPLFSCEETR